MGLRETLNQNPKITTGVTAGLVLVILAYLLYSGMSGGRPGVGSSASKAFFTDDDGKTWFADDAKKVSPFDHGGKQAVLARVYKCGGKTFVNHMERYTPEAKKKVEEVIAKGKVQNDPTALDVGAGLQVKAPGQKDWVSSTDPKAPQIFAPNRR